MRILLSLALGAAIALGACAGDAAPTGNKCTAALYDRCVTEHDCMSNSCYTFAGAGLVCTTACDAQTPCPDQGGEAVACNAMGLCEPAAANDCALE